MTDKKVPIVRYTDGGREIIGEAEVSFEEDGIMLYGELKFTDGSSESLEKQIKHYGLSTEED